MTDLASGINLDFLHGAYDDPNHRAHLESAGDHWEVNDSSFDSYSKSAAIGGHKLGLRWLLQERLGIDCGNVGLDIAGGSNGVALRDLIVLGVLANGAVTNYEDKMTLPINGVEHIDGNIQDRATWDKITTWQQRAAPGGLDLIMHRPIGGMQRMNFRFYRGALQATLDLVRPGGILFTQVPRSILQKSSKTQLGIVCRDLERRDDIEEIKHMNNEDWSVDRAIRSAIFSDKFVTIIKKPEPVQ